MQSRVFQIVVRILALSLVYFVTGRLGLMLPAYGSHITLVWLPTGIAVAALVRCSFSCWPGVFLGSLAVNLAVGSLWTESIGISTGNTIGPLLAAWLLRRTGFHSTFDRNRDILLLAGAAAAGMLVSSTSGVLVLSVGGWIPFGRHEAWLTWWAGDTMGVVSAAPLFLSFGREEWRAIVSRRGEFLAWIGATALIVGGVFVVNRTGEHPALALAFLPLPLVAWAALRFGAVGTSFGIIFLSIGAAYGTSTGRGPFFRPNPFEQIILVWLFMLTSAVLGWLITALHAARLKANAIQRVLERALSDVSLGVLLTGLDRNITYANLGFTRLTGYSEAELIGQSCRILHGPKTDPATAERLKAAVYSDGHFDGEILNYRKDGVPFWNALLISPVHNEQNQMTGFLGIQRNITKRREAEMALQHSEEHLRSIVDLEPECVMLLSADGRLMELNPAGLSMIEASAFEEVRGHAMGTFIAPEDRGAFEEMFERVMRGEAARGELTIVGRNGSRRKGETHAVPYRNGDRSILGMLGITRDITERKAVEARSESERALLELMASGAPLGVVLERLVLGFEKLFPGSICSILLLDSDGKRVRHGAAPSLPEAYWSAIDGVEIGPVAGSCGTAAFTRRTTIVSDIASDPLWASYRELALAHGLKACWSVPVISSDARVLGTFAVYYRQPQTARAEEIEALERVGKFAALAFERNELLASLRASEAALQAAQARAHLGSWELELASGRGWWSQEMFHLFYRERASGPPDFERFLEMVHPEDRQAVLRVHERLGEAGGLKMIEFRSNPEIGPMRYFSALIESFANTAGHPARAAGTVLDITASREAQMAREQIDRKMQETQKLESLGVLAGGIAHDFNNLLTGIIGNASLASLDLPVGSRVHEYIDQINHSAMRAADLCKQMLAYSGRGRFIVQHLDLGALVRETVQMLQISISKKAVLRFNLEKVLPPVEVDATQIRQVVMNLVINASEAIADKSGVITLTTGMLHVDRAYLGGTLIAPELPEGDYVFLEVSDNGCGMSAETQAKIFDPFFSTKFTGRGLGLAAVLGIVRGHKGALKVYSEEGRGTAFKLLFPAQSGPAETPVDATPSVARWRGWGAVLVVDDEEPVRTTVGRMLSVSGFEPVLVRDGREALSVFTADPERFVFVLLDLTMPHMDGAETFAQLRRIRPDVRVVLMSGFNQQDALVRFPGKGLASFLQKPFNVDALSAVLEKVLG